MRILLIAPPFQRLKGIRDVHFPLGLGYLAAVLEQAGHEVKIYNAESPETREQCVELAPSNLLERHERYVRSLREDVHPVWDEITATLSMYQPDIVGVTVVTAKYSSALKVSTLAKHLDPRVLVVWGGPHPTIQAEGCLKSEAVDFVVRGEGEKTILELVQYLQAGGDLARIAGLSFKLDSRIVHNGPRPLIEDLDELPFPAKHLLIYPERYSPSDLNTMVCSRGCPYNCGFCGAQNLWTRRVRFRSLTNVTAEIRELMNQYGIRSLRFCDDTFTVNRQKVIDLCQALISDRMNIFWTCTVRIDRVDEELLTHMNAAGCIDLNVGVESGSQRILNIMEKDIRLELIEPTFRLITQKILYSRAYFMMGIPGERKEDIEATMGLMGRLGRIGVGVIFSIFTPYPGTRLYNAAVESGLLPTEPDWAQYSHQSPMNYFTKEITREEFDVLLRRTTQTVEKINAAQRAREIGVRHMLRSIIIRRPYIIKHPQWFLRRSIGFVASKLGLV